MVVRSLHRQLDRPLGKQAGSSICLNVLDPDTDTLIPSQTATGVLLRESLTTSQTNFLFCDCQVPPAPEHLTDPSLSEKHTSRINNAGTTAELILYVLSNSLLMLQHAASSTPRQEKPKVYPIHICYWL
ncbi:hypothetical protein RRG08_054461 [Elysia crispata]|uniref:Uncharacterized protein n=1 Tax=Elysia crispata TaxID=231223 RepID=A0AAE1CU98_9GAST|nr:hypothetical protein RRG08_054461 [Elysia crispata]